MRKIDLALWEERLTKSKTVGESLVAGLSLLAALEEIRDTAYVTEDAGAFVSEVLEMLGKPKWKVD